MSEAKSDLGVFLQSRDLLDLPEDTLIDMATTASWPGLRLRAKFLLDKKAARDGAILATTRMRKESDE